MSTEHGGILHTAAGRVRLPWRLAAFVALALGLAVGVGWLLPLGGGLFVGALVAGWVLLAWDGQPPAALGFHVEASAPRELALGTALGCAVAALAALALALTGTLAWSWEGADPLAWAGAAAGSLLFFLLPAAAEEALFRGYPLQALADAFGSTPALWITSVGFALLHFANPDLSWRAVASIVAAGLFLGVLVLRTGSLWWATGAHLGWNWLHGFAADLPVSGLDPVDQPGLEATLGGPAWLSGGAFGVEGSLLATALLLLAAGAAARSEALRRPAWTPAGGRWWRGERSPGTEVRAA